MPLMTNARGMPEKLFSREAVHDWSHYESGLAQSPLTSHYLGASLCNWVQGTKHTPLQVPWLAGLLEFGNAGIEKFLQSFEQAIGELALRELVQDLFRESSPREASNQIQSFYAEFVAAEHLRKMHGTVNKVVKYADWEANGVFVSVKAILGSDFNYELMRNLLLGMVLVDENQILRDWGSIHLHDLAGADYRFMRYVLDFLEEELIPHLKNISTADLMGPKRLQWTDVRPFDEANSAKTEKLCISLSSCQNSITARFEAERTDKRLLSKVSLQFVRTKGDMIEIGTQLDASSSFFMPADHLLALSRKITEKVGQMATAFERRPTGFQGWLDLPIHPHYEKYAATSHDFRAMLRRAVGEPAFSIDVCLRGGFDLASPQIFRISAEE